MIVIKNNCLCFFPLPVRGKRFVFIENAEKAIKLNPKYSIIHYNLGLAYLERGNHFSHSVHEKAFNYNIAIEKLKNMLEIFPEHIRAYEFLGICYVEFSKINNKQENVSLAIQYLKEGFEKGADNLLLVDLYLNQDKLDDALYILEILYERNKDVVHEFYKDGNLKPQYKVLENEVRFKKLLSK
ncbi:tetratricopeptide repeat protein [Sphingobacterium sp. GVS05A]|uniref:tetratricopeptide repeat protein n=1 Tax=Sphingobacterium sp. GVS05A TaxID=2862679 RepID=UPI001CC10D20|nr:tetratricopeptide repeat protein [Sphingobacterium sp. GVS05A]